MRDKILIIQNITHEKPGLIRDLLNKEQIDYDILDLSQKLQFPNIERYKLLIILGGPDSANDSSEKILKELEFVNQALKKKIPILGICLGLQLIVKALGGYVLKNFVAEIGFRYNTEWNYIHLTNEGIKDPIFKGVSKTFKAFHLHGETVKLIDKLKLLGTGEFCKNQVIKIGEFNYGFQFHFELTSQMLNEWIYKAPELYGKNKYEILNDFEVVMEDYTERGRKIILNYLKLIKIL